MIIKPINDVKKSLFKKFDCGNKALNEYLQKYANQNEKNHLSRTYILENDGSILGYVTLCNTQIDAKEMPSDYSKLPKYPIPGVKIARLAVDIEYQRKHFGEMLLTFALKRIVLVSASVGIKVVVVDAKEESRQFYEKYGFISLTNNSLTYILPIETVLKALL